MFNKARVMLAAMSMLAAKLPFVSKFRSSKTPQTLMHESKGDWWSDNRARGATSRNKAQAKAFEKRNIKKRMATLSRRRNKQWPSYSQRRT